MRYAIYTLGCKVNQYESQAMEQILTDLGHEEVDLAADFDVCIINTCTVTAVADKKNRNVIRRLKKLHPEAVIAVCGCYSQLKPDEVRALGVDVVSGSAGREAFLQMVLSAAKDRAPRVDVDRALERRTFELLPAGGLAARTCVCTRAGALHAVGAGLVRGRTAEAGGIPGDRADRHRGGLVGP